jgi:hypothetical protein
VIVALVVLPVYVGMNAASTGSFRDRSDVFAIMMLAPVCLVLPLVVSLLTCLRLYRELGRRFVGNTRSRTDIRVLLLRRFAVASAAAALIFFSYAFVPFLVAFVVWPVLGDPSIDPLGYGMTPAEAVTDSYSRSSYDFLLRGGDYAFGFGYAAWLGLAAAAYAILCCCFLVTLHNGVLALALPFLIYFGATVAAALIGEPNIGPVYSLFPFGLQATSPIVAAAPTLLIMAGTFLFAVVVIAKAPTNPRLT